MGIAALHPSYRPRLFAPYEFSTWGSLYPSAIMWSAHELHGVFDMAPLSGLLGLSLALAGHGIPRRPGDRLEAVLLDHLPRDRVNLRLGYHVALPCSALPEPRWDTPRCLPNTLNI